MVKYHVSQEQKDRYNANRRLKYATDPDWRQAVLNRCRKYVASPAGKANRKIEYLRHKDQARAQMAVYYGVKQKKIVKNTKCDICCSETTTEAHHHRGYDKENVLNVLWVCDSCHAKIHHGFIKGV